MHVLSHFAPPASAGRRKPSGWRAGVFAATALGVTGVFTCVPAAAQTPVMARPASYTTWNNKTGALTNGAAIMYNANTDTYVNAQVVQGVPNNNISYVVTQGNPNGLGLLMNTVRVPGMGTAPDQLLNLTVPAGTPNTSLGGLIDRFGWGAADVVMNQCFAGGFAFNIAGSLQGAVPAGGGAAVAPANRIGYTFASGANFNELSYGYAAPGNATPATATQVADFTQGHAFGSTGPGPFGNFASYQNGYQADPFTAGHAGYGVANQLPNNGGPVLKAGLFESPVYASSDAPGAGGAVNAAAANNARTFATAPDHRWAVLVAFTPDRAEFNLDIQREYAALISNGIDRSHIAVLYGDGNAASLARFTSIATGPPAASNNNIPNVNGILNTVAANFTVPVQGAASQANLAGLLNPDLIQNPTAPPANRVDYWQFLFGTGPGGARPAAGDNLLFYSTGHGSAVNILGGNVTAVNNVGGNAGNQVFTTSITLTGPDNVQITPGMNLTAQITVRGALTDPGSDTFFIDGHPIGGDTLVSVAGGTALDMTSLLEPDGGPALAYYDITFPASDLDAIGGSDNVFFSISSGDDDAITSFDQGVAAITFLDASPDVAATGAVDAYTDFVSASVPEPSALLLGAIGFGTAFGLRWWRQWRAGQPFEYAIKTTPRDPRA
jgi:hypothetical protein